MERFLEYWRASSYQQQLHALIPSSVKSSWQTITRAECTRGKLNPTTLRYMVMPGTMVIVPFYARQIDKYFFPLLLLVDVQPNGEFIVQPHLSLPIVPRTFLDPAPLNPISLGTAESFDNYLAINLPEWLDEPESLSWTAQLEYATTMLDEICPHWHTDISNAGYTFAEEAIIFPLESLTNANPQQLENVNFDLFEQTHKVTLINADNGSDTSTYIKQIIINAWIHAAIKQIDPPQYVWLQPNKATTYASIFACFAASSIAHNSDDMYSKLLTAYDNFMQGQQVLRNWQEFSKRIVEKYADKGGVQARIEHLQKLTKEVKAQTRNLQVLQSIWVRQKELVVEWTKIFDFIPSLQKQRLQRLHDFFKQNFPQDDVKGFTETQFDELINEKIFRSENNERMLGDALHQVENDLYQETLVRDKCISWCNEQGLQSADLNAIQSFMTDRLWWKIAHLALMYWQQDFTAKQGRGDFLQVEPKDVDLLLVEHAHYVSPQQAVHWLSKSKRAVVIGNYNPICNPKYPVQIDYELTKHYALIEHEADFEDLQFDGVLSSVGNMWSMLAKDCEADQFLNADANTELEYEFVDQAGDAADYLGSRANQGVVSALLDWLHSHAEARNEIAIYTCFAGQVQLIRKALQATFYAQIPIYLIQEPNFVRNQINIFLPVYTSKDPGPYIFDRGTEMLDQLLANTQERLVIIGDARIFKPELHSAIGNFAKTIFNQEQEQQEHITIFEEVDCV